jgi:adenosylcobyric acid synthase
MVQGTASDVGKSLLVTALCRLYARQGVRVAPFKAQNMALNSTVTVDGAEIGRAQYAQAEAARVVATADMNPILLKPETGSRSQVIVLGRPVGSSHFRDYRARYTELRKVVTGALGRLRESYDLVVIEGAGSPAELNLRDGDLVNMWVAEQADAPVLLVTDIERGGAIAALFGTLALLEPQERALVKGLVVNKFRGDASLFTDGVKIIEERCGVPVLGVVPHMGDARIASEDSLALRSNGGGLVIIAVIRMPHVSNFDEFEPLGREPGVELRWCETPEQLDGAALVILPGTKCTVADLTWLRRTGLAGAIVRRAEAHQPVLGICGGYQMLGQQILDPLGVESPEREVPGLDLLPVVTRFAPEKLTARVRMKLTEGLPLLGEAGGAVVEGYEIHHGRQDVAGGPSFGTILQRGQTSVSDPEGAISISGAVAGTTVHGLFENARVRSALLAATGAGVAPPETDPYEAVADHFARALDMAFIDRLIGLR